jgi:predicted SprT family Zn-dependent metalloprotease
MRALGVAPHRCHQYDTSKVRRRKPTVTYLCACNEGTKRWNLGVIRHQRHQKHGGKKYFCKDCRAYLLLQE